MVEMWCGMECVLWVVWCVIYIWMWRCAWCGARWACEMVCWHVVESRDLRWIMVRCEMWCDVYVVRCGMLHFQTWCDVKCKMCDVEYGVVWTVVPRQLCGMLHNAKCGKLGDVKCGGVELWWWRIVVVKNVAYAMCCGCVTSEVENDAMCCDVSCGGVTM